jgi:hypothetical protein
MVHMTMSAFVIYAVYRWGDWRNWQQYHSTMLYIAVSNLMYNFLCANYFLWRLSSELISNHTLTEVLYTLIVFPGTALLFLSNYPDTLNKKLVYYLKWIGIYIGFEAVYVVFKKIEYQYDWNIFWSFVFLIVMFPMLRLHYKRPLLTYVVSLPVAIFLLWVFEVPVHLPVEQR